MYMFRLVALSLLLCATPAAARDRATQRTSITSATVPPDVARPSAPLSGRYAVPGPSNARFPLVSNLDVGVGLYSVGGHFVRERESTMAASRSSGTAGRANRIAAVGLSLRF